MLSSPVSFVGSAPDTPAATPVSPFRKAPVDPVGYLPETSRTRLALLRAAKPQAESALEIAVDAGVTDEFLGGLREERAVTAANLRAVEEFLSNLRAPVEALPPANVAKQTIEGIRSEIEKVEARMTALHLMLPTRAEQVERLKVMVAAAGANVGTETFRLAHAPHSNVADQALEFLKVLGPRADAIGLLAAIFPDAIVTRLSETIPDDPEGALPHAERTEAIAQARAELLRLGWAEECLIRQAATPLHRRSTALAECLLGVAAQ